MNSHLYGWQHAYFAALLEVHPPSLLTRISKAENQIIKRLLRLSGKRSDPQELRALIEAMKDLEGLRREIAESAKSKSSKSAPTQNHVSRIEESNPPSVSADMLRTADDTSTATTAEARRKAAHRH